MLCTRYTMPLPGFVSSSSQLSVLSPLMLSGTRLAVVSTSFRTRPMLTTGTRRTCVRLCGVS